MTRAAAPPQIAVTEDDFLGGRLRLRQPVDGLRAGLDGVLLAAATDAREGEHVLDAGAGTGVVALCLAARCPGVRVTGVEIDPGLVALAAQNAQRNSLDDRVAFLAADLTQPTTALADLGLLAESFDQALANPPYHAAGTVRAARAGRKATASVLGPEGLDRWVRFLAAMVRPAGRATLVFRADGLGVLLAALEGRFGALEVLPLHPRAGAPANRVLVRGVKGSRAPLTLHAGRALHGPDNGFLPEIDAILRQGAALVWRGST